MTENYHQNMSSSDLLAVRIQQLQKKPEDIRKAAVTLKKARMRSKEQFERKFERRMRKEVFSPGDLVLIRNSRVEQEANCKSKPRYLGPYKIYRQTKGGSYVLQELDGAFLRQAIAAFRLLPYVSRDDPVLEEFADIPDEEEPLPANQPVSEEADPTSSSNDESQLSYS